MYITGYQVEVVALLSNAPLHDETGIGGALALYASVPMCGHRRADCHPLSSILLAIQWLLN